MNKIKPRSVPNWDDYFITLCFIVASRSKDPSTQHGAIIVDDKHRIQSTGYNGTPPGINDTDISWGRPEKYPFIIHAEENAINHCGGHPDVLISSTIYVTGAPCSSCVRRIIGRKIKKIIYGPQCSNMITEEDWEITKELVRLSKINLERFTGNISWLRDRLYWMEENLPDIFQPQINLPL